MCRSGGSYERIHDRQLLARMFRLSLEPAPAKRRLQVQLQNPSGKALDKIEPDPGLQFFFFVPSDRLLIPFCTSPRLRTLRNRVCSSCPSSQFTNAGFGSFLTVRKSNRPRADTSQLHLAGEIGTAAEVEFNLTKGRLPEKLR